MSDATTTTKAAEKIAKAQTDELLAVLREAMTLMPLGTAKRAAWLRRAGSVVAKAEGR